MALQKEIAPLNEESIGNNPPPKYSNVDSAVSMTFPESVQNHLAQFEGSENGHNMGSLNVNNTHSSNHGITTSTENTTRPSFITVEGMPFNFEKIMEMGQVLAQARREKKFPLTITPGYDLKATIDDYEALQRLNAAREGEINTGDDAFRPDVARLYIDIQRKIQDRDLTYGEVAADSNVRARLSGFANGTGAETGMYNLMRHAVNSVLRLNNLAVGGDSNIVDAVVTRVVNEIRSTVQNQAARGAHGVTEQNMGDVLEQVFTNIEKSLDLNNQLGSITKTQNIQVDAIAGHVNAIDNHVQAMGNNVNAMGSLLNSTNGNVTALGTNIITLQTVVNMIPQMVAKAVADILPQAVHGAVGEAFEAAISNELLNRMQNFVSAVDGARARAEAAGNHGRQNSKMRNWFGRLNIFKKRPGRRGSSVGTAH